MSYLYEKDKKLCLVKKNLNLLNEEKKQAYWDSRSRFKESDKWPVYRDFAKTHAYTNRFKFCTVKILKQQDNKVSLSAYSMRFSETAADLHNWEKSCKIEQIRQKIYL